MVVMTFNLSSFFLWVEKWIKLKTGLRFSDTLCFKAHPEVAKISFTAEEEEKNTL